MSETLALLLLLIGLQLISPAALTGLESGKRQPIGTRPQSMLEGRDLPTCDLSNFLQRQLDETLAADRAARAAAIGRDISQVSNTEY